MVYAKIRHLSKRYYSGIFCRLSSARILTYSCIPIVSIDANRMSLVLMIKQINFILSCQRALSLVPDLSIQTQGLKQAGMTTKAINCWHDSFIFLRESKALNDSLTHGATSHLEVRWVYYIIKVLSGSESTAWLLCVGMVFI